MNETLSRKDARRLLRQVRYHMTNEIADSQRLLDRANDLLKSLDTNEKTLEELEEDILYLSNCYR